MSVTSELKYACTCSPLAQYKTMKELDEHMHVEHNWKGTWTDPTPKAGHMYTFNALTTNAPLGDSAQRKATPVYSGCLAYFPLALAAIARLSKFGNDKHNPGEPLHWSRNKSDDHLDSLARHLLEAGNVDPETGEAHDLEIGWRALANLQIVEEKRLGIYRSET